jgi:6-pyruvoyltetrahydropterin/6-carboxytetrahydropterin synthase
MLERIAVPEESDMSVEVVQAFRFEAAHYLPNVPDTHRCKNMHGHSYRIDVHVAGPVDPFSGMVIDFFDVDDAFEPVLKLLDHQVLNEVEGLENPTAEHIAIWIFNQLHALKGLSQVVVHETEFSRAVYSG